MTTEEWRASKAEAKQIWEGRTHRDCAHLYWDRKMKQYLCGLDYRSRIDNIKGQGCDWYAPLSAIGAAKTDGGER